MSAAPDHVLAAAAPFDAKAGGLPVLEIIPSRRFATRLGLALADLREGARLWRLCWTLAWLDIRIRYRGSVLGPFWLTLSTGVMVGAMGAIYGTLFKMDLRDYLPFLATSQVLWNYLNSVVSEGCTSYIDSEGMIRAVRMPFTLYAARVVLRNLLILAHNLVVILGVFLVMWTWPGAEVLLALPGLALWLVDLLAAAMLLGAVCARFRDIPPIVGSVMQMAFFVTPVIWRPQLLEDKAWMLPYNPFYSVLEVLRGPLLGEIPSWSAYGSAIGFSLVLWVIAALMFARVRARIAFWV